MQLSTKELIRKERLKEKEGSKEGINFILDNLWENNPQDPFREDFTRKIQRNILVGFVHAFMEDSKEELMTYFSATDHQVRKIRAFILFFHSSQINGHRSFRPPRASSQDYFDFTSDPSLWPGMD